VVRQQRGALVEVLCILLLDRARKRGVYSAAPLAQFLAAELAREDADKAAGKTPKPSDNIRGYALLIADDYAKMAEALDGRREALLVGAMDERAGFAIVNCIDRTAAEEAFARLRDQLGTHRFEEWFASKGLVQLPTME